MFAEHKQSKGSKAPSTDKGGTTLFVLPDVRPAGAPLPPRRRLCLHPLTAATPQSS